MTKREKITEYERVISLIQSDRFEHVYLCRELLEPCVEEFLLFKELNYTTSWLVEQLFIEEIILGGTFTEVAHETNAHRIFILQLLIEMNK